MRQRNINELRCKRDWREPFGTAQGVGGARPSHASAVGHGDLELWQERCYGIVHLIRVAQRAPDLVGDFCPMSVKLWHERIYAGCIDLDRSKSLLVKGYCVACSYDLYSR